MAPEHSTPCLGDRQHESLSDFHRETDVLCILSITWTDRCALYPQHHLDRQMCSAFSASLGSMLSCALSLLPGAP